MLECTQPSVKSARDQFPPRTIYPEPFGTSGTAERSVNALWRQVTDGEEKSHNSQMDVVLALWKNKFINIQ